MRSAARNQQGIARESTGYDPEKLN